ncbi:MAG: hypothetical protein Ct9H90mP21_1770 [Methanobacteriota archaeon]|nr:MAG: hypothetical protein Ct9H90mP21_1770 [Euryarchaeota archaeon]
MKNFESMLSGPQGFGEFLKKMGVDIHIKPSVSEVRVDVDESTIQTRTTQFFPDDVYIKGKRDVRHYRCFQVRGYRSG